MITPRMAGGSSKITRLCFNPQGNKVCEVPVFKYYNMGPKVNFYKLLKQMTKGFIKL